jgi:hypothetical protein
MGNVLFDGDAQSVPPPAYGMIRRTYRSKISETSVHALFDAFRKAQFFWLYDEYGQVAIDAPICSISIEFDRRKKKVMIFSCQAAGMPKEVTELEDMIDHTTGTEKLLTFERAPPDDIKPPEPPLTTVTVPKLSPPEITIEETKTTH